jgi:hypothetical protein
MQGVIDGKSGKEGNQLITHTFVCNVSMMICVRNFVANVCKGRLN